jgi:hypothetical protein
MARDSTDYGEGFLPSYFGSKPFGQSPTWQTLGPQGLPWDLHAEAGKSRLQGQQIEGTLEGARIAANAAMYPANLQQQRFNSVFPWIQQQFSGYGGGQGGQQPTIKVGGVWNPKQIQGQVNQTRAQNDQAMRTQQREQSQQAAAGGFGARSPLLAALQGQAFGANLGVNTQAEQQLRTQMSQMNAQQLLATQQAKEAQFGSRQKEDIQRKNALLAALSGLV